MTNKNARIKVLFILPSLKAGGAERVISSIASNIDKQKFESVLIVIGNASESVYSTHGIETYHLNKKRVLYAIPVLFQYIFKMNPKIVVGSISHVNRVIAAFSVFFPKTNFIGREASVLSIMKNYSTKRRNSFNPFFKNYHKYLDSIICQSLDMATDLQKNYSVPKKKITIINNPVSEGFPLKNENTRTDNINQLITIGRLSKEKGHERLLNIIAKLEAPYHYTIIGSGIEKDNIMELAKILNISHKITHISYTNNVALYLSQSDLFLQGSYVEGFPNAVLESCAVGTPVLAFKAPGGLKEIVIEGVNGIIVDSETKFLSKLNEFDKTKWDSKKISNSVYNKFNKKLILTKYENLFIENL